MPDKKLQQWYSFLEFETNHCILLLGRRNSDLKSLLPGFNYH